VSQFADLHGRGENRPLLFHPVYDSERFSSWLKNYSPENQNFNKRAYTLA